MTIVLGVLVLMVWVTRRMLLAKYDFVARVAGDHVTVTGRIPAPLKSALADFLVRDFPRPRRLTIRGRYRPDRTVQLVFHPDVPRGDQQRLRNFLMAGR